MEFTRRKAAEAALARVRDERKVSDLEGMHRARRPWSSTSKAGRCLDLDIQELLQGREEMPRQADVEGQGDVLHPPGSPEIDLVAENKARPLRAPMARARGGGAVWDAMPRVDSDVASLLDSRLANEVQGAKTAMQQMVRRTTSSWERQLSVLEQDVEWTSVALQDARQLASSLVRWLVDEVDGCKVLRTLWRRRRWWCWRCLQTANR